MPKARLALLALLITPLLSVAAPARADTLAILPLSATDVARAKVDTLNDSLAAASSDLFALRMLGAAEVRELLGPAQQKAMAGCDNLFCWAKTGTALQATHVLAVKATGAGASILLSITWVDVAGNRVLMRHQQPIRDDLVAFPAETRAVLTQVREKLPAELRSSGPVRPLPPPAAATAAATPKATPTATAAPPPAAPATKPVEAPAAPKQPAWLGVGHRSMDDVTNAETKNERKYGAYVQRVAADGPAAKAGLREGDVLLKLNGMIIGSSDALRRFLKTLHAGDSAAFLVWSKGEEKTLTVLLEPPPAKE